MVRIWHVLHTSPCCMLQGSGLNHARTALPWADGQEHSPLPSQPNSTHPNFQSSLNLTQLEDEVRCHGCCLRRRRPGLRGPQVRVGETRRSLVRSLLAVFRVLIWYHNKLWSISCTVEGVPKSFKHLTTLVPYLPYPPPFLGRGRD